MPNLKKISVSELRSGMYLHALSGSWIDHPFWRAKFVIEDLDDIKLIALSKISEVWIDVDKGADTRQMVVPAEPAEVPAKAPARVPLIAPKPVSMADEIDRARKIYDSASKAVQSMFRETRMGRAISMEAAGAVVQDISLSIMRNPGALISVVRLKHVDDYTYMHSVAVCALMVALARQLNLSEADTREAGMAGLLHDLGKVDTPPEILNKTGRLTDEEFAIVKQHPVQGHAHLKQSGQVGEIAMDVCLHHHERIDGKGYPHGLAGDDISLFAKMGAVCDVYDAITSNRPYKHGWCPAESIKRMTEWSVDQYDKRIFQAFVSSVGIYPVGSLVRLSSGKLGVVMEQSAKSLIAPRVKVFFSTKSGVYITPTIVDLSQSISEDNAEKIVGYEDAAKWKIRNFDQMWAG